MKAIGFHTPGPIERDDALLDLEIPPPTPGPRDLLVRVQAVSVNPVDTKVRAAATPPPGEPRILGYDASGVVEAVGSEVTLFRPGDEVYYAGDLTRPGANSELHAVDERIVGRKPSSLDWAQAAALPLTALTAWELLFDRLRISRGEERPGALLVINGAGGVGSILVQIARRLTGLTVIATASRPETSAWVQEMGAHHVINHSEPLDQELARIGIPEVAYVASLTASDRYLPIFPTIIAPQGHIALIDDPPAFDVVPLKRKSITVAWELMFTRSMFGTPDLERQHDILEEVSRLVDQGILRTTLTRTASPISAARLREAHAAQESGRAIGKTVLMGFPG